MELPRRHCPQCGLLRGAGDDSGLCPHCSRYPSGGRWLTAAPMREALGRREVAAIVRAYRQVTGTTQRALAWRLNLDPSKISRIETGRDPVRDIGVRARIASRLGIPAQALGLTAEAGDGLSAAPELPRALGQAWRDHHDLSALELLEVIGRVTGGDTYGRVRIWHNRFTMGWPEPLGEIDRRSFFSHLSVATGLFLAGGWELKGEALERLTALTAPRRLDLATVECVEQMATLFRRSLREIRLPSRIQLGDALGQMKRLLALELATQSEPVRRRLVRLIGENAVLAGHLANLGLADLTAGEAYLDIAQAAARETGYGELEAVVFAERSYVARLRGLPGQRLQLLEAGLGVAAGATPTTRALLASASAVGLAGSGQPSASLRRLEQAREALAELSAPAPDWIGFGAFEGVGLAAREGAALLGLGRPGDARGVLQATLTRAEPSHSWYGDLLAGLSASLVAEGELAEGVRLAGEVLARATSFEDAELAGQVRDLHAGLLDRAAGDPAVHELGERLALAGLNG